jgi:hypothetical protein
LKPAQANSSRDPISKNKKSQKRFGGGAQGVGLEFKPQYCQKKNKKKSYLAQNANCAKLRNPDLEA